MSLFNGLVGFQVGKRVKDSKGDETGHWDAFGWIILCMSPFLFIII